MESSSSSPMYYLHQQQQQQLQVQSQHDQLCSQPMAAAANRITPCNGGLSRSGSDGSINNSSWSGDSSGCHAQYELPTRRPASASSSHPRAPPPQANTHTTNDVVNSSSNNNGILNNDDDDASSGNDANNNSRPASQPNMKRQRVTSPATDATANNENGRRTTLVPMRLCIPMLLLALTAQASAGSAVHAATGSDDTIIPIIGNGIAGGGKAYRANAMMPVPPSRPGGAVDVDYGGAHPFDAHRHSYDAAFARRRKENTAGPLRRSESNELLNNAMDSGGGGARRLKKDEEEKNKDKEKDKDEEEDKWAWEEEKEKKTDEPTKKPTKKPTEAPVKSKKAEEVDKDGLLTFNPANDNGPANLPVQTQTVSQTKDAVDAFKPADSSSTFEAPETLTVAAATNGDGNGRSTNHKTTTLDPETDHLYSPLRIQFDTRQLAQQMDLMLSAGDGIAATKLYLLIYEILPMTARVWGDILRVVPVSGGIYPLAAQGSGVDQLLPNGQSNENDATAGEDREAYVDPVRLVYCPDETTSGIEGGADLLIYATVNRHCAGSSGGATDGGGNAENMGTLASALACQRDQYDRPITGSIDFCLEGMKGISQMDVASGIANKEAQKRNNNGGGGGNSNGNGGSGGGSKTSQYMMGGEDGTSFEWDGWGSKSSGTGGSTTASTSPLQDNQGVIQYSVGVAVHEMGHVLGVTSDSLAYFRHPLTGHPLTRRPFEISTVTCVNGQSMTYVGMPGPAVLQEGRHESTGNRHFEVVTPAVRRVVQNHFNCPSMTGARLENQPTSSDCFGSHFDEMLYYTEIMGAVFSQSVNILSPLTLALLEDSGWYRANYESNFVQISVFGHGAGCDFIDNSCIDSKGNVPPEFTEHFCNDPISVSANGVINTLSSGSQTCDPSHTQKTYCDLVNINEVVPIGKTGITLEPAPLEYQYFRPNYRPYIFINADYCPVPHLDPQSCIKYSGRGTISDEQRQAGEYYGADSRCVETDGTRSYSLCLKTTCNLGEGIVELTAGGEVRKCQYDGQTHTILYNQGGGGELKIKCPKAALVCPQLFCPANCAGRGECVYEADREYGDDDVFYNTNAQARCKCDSEEDTSAGCFDSNLVFPKVYGYAYENPNKANKTLFMIIVGSVVAGLAVMFMAVRQWKAKQNVFM